VRVAITGATGFIGRRIASLLESPQYLVRALARDAALRAAVVRKQRERLARYEARDLAAELRAHLAPLLGG